MRQVELVPIERIVIRKLRRQDLGDVLSLANSMKKYSQLEPIAVDVDYELVFGHRRLEAAKLNGWTHIEALRWEHLTFEERLAIELEENTERKDFTPAELSLRLVEKAEMVADVIEKEKADQSLIIPDNGEIKEDTESIEPKTEGKGGKRKGSGRKPKNRVTQKAKAEKLGVAPQTLSNAEIHVSFLTKYPELSEHFITQQDAITMGKALDAMEEEPREKARSLLQKGDSDTMLHLAGKRTNRDVIENGGKGLTLKADKPKRLATIENYETFCHMVERWEIFYGEVEKAGGVEELLGRLSEPLRINAVSDITRMYEKVKTMYEVAIAMKSTIDL